MSIFAESLDLAAVRARFSALDRRVGGQPARFFDGAGGSQVPDEVIEAVAGYLRHSNANEGGAFATSRETDTVLRDAHAAVADLLGATPSQVAFGANMTTLNFALTTAFGRTLHAGDEIVVTQLDHEGNVSPWRIMAADRGLVVHTVPVRAEDGTLRLDELERVLGPRTRAVAFTLASNALGTIPDARRIVALAHEAGALAWADGVHAAPHLGLDVGDLGVDVLLCSPYKFFGPHLGVAAIREDLAAQWPANRVAPAAEQPAGHRFETGTLAHELLAGTTAAVDYLASLPSGVSGPAGAPGAPADRRARIQAAYAAIEAHERALTDRFLATVGELTGVTVYGITDRDRLAERTPTFLLRVAGQTPEATATALGKQGFFVWHGNFYAPGATRGVGLDAAGGVRAGFLHYTTPEEVDDFVAALAALGG
jgi:cysteine desulfurase family protein (TIGR01976 family)